MIDKTLHEFARRLAALKVAYKRPENMPKVLVRKSPGPHTMKNMEEMRPYKGIGWVLLKFTDESKVQEAFNLARAAADEVFRDPEDIVWCVLMPHKEDPSPYAQCGWIGAKPKRYSPL